MYTFRNFGPSEITKKKDEPDDQTRDDISFWKVMDALTVS